VGGGGRGGYGASTAAVAGQANTGGGGGGDWNNIGAGAGGSGIVIVSYPDIYPALTTGGATSPTVSTSGSGSIVFSGSNYVTTAASSNLALGTNTFTLEYWINVTNSGTSGQNGLEFGAASYNPKFAYVTATNTLGIYVAAASGSWGIASAVTIGTIASATWYHVAIVRNGSTWYTFLNGVQGATFSNASSVYQTTNTIGIGSGENGSIPFTGYMSNVRFVRGTALYTANFTPPTAPLTAITNTQLLLNTVSGSVFADASSNSLTQTATGSPAWNQQSPFATGLGYKNRVYTWAPTVSAGSTATGTFTV
jgi:hypothetical protein